MVVMDCASETPAICILITPVISIAGSRLASSDGPTNSDLLALPSGGVIVAIDYCLPLGSSNAVWMLTLKRWRVIKDLL